LIGTFQNGYLNHVGFVTMSRDGKFCFTDGAWQNETTMILQKNGGNNTERTYRPLRINLFRSDPRSGKLTRFMSMSAQPLGSDAVLAKSRDGRFLVAASNSYPAVLNVLTALALQDTELLPPEYFPELPGFTGVALSPDGRHAYFASTGPSQPNNRSTSAHHGRIRIFERGKDGTLKDSSTTYHDLNGSLDHVAALACAPDGRTLFACCPKSSQLVVFRRDPNSGQLNERETLSNGSHGISCLAGVNAVDMSPDSRFLYTVAGYEQGKGAVGVFEIHPAGAIELLQQFLYRDPGLEHFFGGHSIVVSSDGRRVYATATILSAIACFERELASGRLHLLGCIHHSRKDGILFPDPTGLAVHPNNRFVYVACRTPGSIAIFENTSLPADAPP